jgi:hypothetical protein
VPNIVKCEEIIQNIDKEEDDISLEIFNKIKNN